ncbi:hypothetical protein DEAC_c40300 [Desulfosporosinus acididurans]|uniref:Uncharacterized protein n=1 Tax=Desulfosporosinus acididurans TaxID=476652 RepID=A0A0J1IHA5_9FIRM|nr:hypothetical protein DEAC_c40300 [Desulfosporosinus acididurans]
MLKCGDKFCCNHIIKSTEDVLKCIKIMQTTCPEWNRECFYHRDGQGCAECGGRVIRQNGCYVCIECGYSPCG